MFSMVPPRMALVLNRSAWLRLGLSSRQFSTKTLRTPPDISMPMVTPPWPSFIWVKIDLTHPDGLCHHLVSLLNLMEEYKLGDFAAMLSGAIIAHDELRTGDNLKRCSPEGVSVREVCSDEFLRNLAIVMDGLLIMCRNFECDPALAVQMESLKQDLDNGLRDRREGVLAARLGQILEGITENLNSRKFMFISADQAKFYDDPLMFGGAFLVTFSEGTKQAVFEMGEAGRCYACGRWTSCVFHCMRAVEFGLRRLFRIAGARLPIHNQVRYQIEYA